jgi:hypothetical protein
MTTAFLALLYLAPVLLVFAGMAALADYLEKHYG